MKLNIGETPGLLLIILPSIDSVHQDSFSSSNILRFAHSSVGGTY